MTLYQPTNKQTHATRPPREFMSVALLVCLMEADWWLWDVVAVETQTTKQPNGEHDNAS